MEGKGPCVQILIMCQCVTRFGKSCIQVSRRERNHLALWISILNVKLFQYWQGERGGEWLYYIPDKPISGFRKHFCSSISPTANRK